MKTPYGNKNREIKETLITPKMAAEWINPDNRRIRKAVVSRYAADMTNGEWTFCPSAIIVSNGRCMDGNHRLSAIIKSGKSIWCALGIWNDIDNILELGVDTGCTRNKADILGISQFSASIWNTVGRSIFKRAPSAHETRLIDEALAPYAEGICASVRHDNLRIPGSRTGAGAAGVLAAILECPEDRFAIENQYSLFISNEDGRWSSVKALANYLLCHPERSRDSSNMLNIFYVAFSRPKLQIVRVNQIDSEKVKKIFCGKIGIENKEARVKQ